MSVRERLVLLSESKEIKKYMELLPSLKYEVLAPKYELSPLVTQQIQLCLKTQSRPHGSKSCLSTEEDLIDWIFNIITKSKLGNVFFLSTPFQNFRWVKCEVINDYWIQELAQHTNFEFTLVNIEQSKIIVFYNEEYEVIYFLYDLPVID